MKNGGMIIIYFRLTCTIGRYQRRPSQIHRPLKRTLVVLVPLAAFIHLSPARRITCLTVDVQTLNMLTYAASRAASGSAAFSVDEKGGFGGTRRPGVQMIRRGRRPRTVRRITRPTQPQPY